MILNVGKLLRIPLYINCKHSSDIGSTCNSWCKVCTYFIYLFYFNYILYNFVFLSDELQLLATFSGHDWLDIVIGSASWINGFNRNGKLQFGHTYDYRLGSSIFSEAHRLHHLPLPPKVECSASNCRFSNFFPNGSCRASYCIPLLLVLQFGDFSSLPSIFSFSPSITPVFFCLFAPPSPYKYSRLLLSPPQWRSKI